MTAALSKRSTHDDGDSEGTDAAQGPRRGRLRSALALAGFGALTVGAAVIGGLATSRGKGLWYRLLRKPSWNPPDWVFGPVWTVLYGMIATSGWRVWRKPPSRERSAALGLWGAQLALNTGWTLLFFGEHQKAAALADLGLLIGSVGAYSGVAAKVDRPAALLMVPYLGWTSFAGALNAEIVRRNP